MKRLLAVGVKGSWEGEWQPAQGNERAIAAGPIGKGETVHLEVERTNGDGVLVISLSDGPVLLQVGEWVRYRVIKDGSRATESLPTTVEMTLNGSAHPPDR